MAADDSTKRKPKGQGGEPQRMGAAELRRQIAALVADRLPESQRAALLWLPEDGSAAEITGDEDIRLLEQNLRFLARKTVFPGVEAVLTASDRRGVHFDRKKGWIGEKWSMTPFGLLVRAALRKGGVTDNG